MDATSPFICINSNTGKIGNFMWVNSDTTIHEYFYSLRDCIEFGGWRFISDWKDNNQWGSYANGYDVVYVDFND